MTEMESAKVKTESTAQKEKVADVKTLLGNALSNGEKRIAGLPGRDEEQAKKDDDAWGSQNI